MKNDCSGIVGAIFGHHFVPAFDEKPRDLPGVKITGMDVDTLENLMTYATVTRIYCRRCGEGRHKSVQT